MPTRYPTKFDLIVKTVRAGLWAQQVCAHSRAAMERKPECRRCTHGITAADPVMLTENGPMKSVVRRRLVDLPAGLPPDFDYAVIRSVDDARSLILVLPNCDRGRAAVGLYERRRLVGREAAYHAIMAAWDHDERETIRAFGSADQFISALKTVAPSLTGLPDRVSAWRGVIVDKIHYRRAAFGLSWTRSRDIACWFATRYYVPELQPSVCPLVLHADLDRRAIVAIHNGRGEQEVLVDPQLLFDHRITIAGRAPIQLIDFRPESDTIDRFIAGWRRAAERYQYWKHRQNSGGIRSPTSNGR